MISGTKRNILLTKIQAHHIPSTLFPYALGQDELSWPREQLSPYRVKMQLPWGLWEASSVSHAGRSNRNGLFWACDCVHRANVGWEGGWTEVREKGPGARGGRRKEKDWGRNPETGGSRLFVYHLEYLWLRTGPMFKVMDPGSWSPPSSLLFPSQQRWHLAFWAHICSCFCSIFSYSVLFGCLAWGTEVWKQHSSCPLRAHSYWIILKSLLLAWSPLVPPKKSLGQASVWHGIMPLALHAPQQSSWIFFCI